MSDATGARRWAPPALWTLLVLVVTSWPNPGDPPVTNGDKLIHVALYAPLGWLLGRAAPGLVRSAPRLLGSAAALSAFAFVDEWHQRFVPGRASSSADWAVDSIGAAAGLLLAAVWLRRRAVA